ncbi:MAG: hypothetical protein ACTS73_05205 [Arsenophonus sp. NEOnobi-MAG3]
MPKGLLRIASRLLIIDVIWLVSLTRVSGKLFATNDNNPEEQMLKTLLELNKDDS